MGEENDEVLENTLVAYIALQKDISHAEGQIAANEAIIGFLEQRNKRLRESIDKLQKECDAL